MNLIKAINTINAPSAIGPYHQAIKTNGFLFCSGQIAIDPKTNQLVTSDIASETEQIMKNICALLEAESLSTGNIVKASIFMRNMDDYAQVNKIYAQYFKDGKYPAREAVAVAGLPKNVNLEISIIATYQWP